MRVRSLVMALLAIFAAGSPASAVAAGGFIGQPLASVEMSGFFTWFNLAATGKQACGGGEVSGFRPTGAQFHALAAVQALTDAKGKVVGMALILDRGFIDDPANGVFARDIAKSFLGDAPGAGFKAAGDLATEIEAHMGEGANVIMRADAAPAPPGPPSPGYLAFLGQRPDFSAGGAGLGLAMVNQVVGGAPRLKVSVFAASADPACLSGVVAT